MGSRNERRNFDDAVTKEIIELLGELNRFCFHGSGADEDCGGCIFEGDTPCPLSKFYDKLQEKLN